MNGYGVSWFGGLRLSDSYELSLGEIPLSTVELAGVDASASSESSTLIVTVGLAGSDTTTSAEAGDLGVGRALAGADASSSSETGTLFSAYFSTTPDVTVSSELASMAVALALAGVDQTNSNELGPTLEGTALGRLATAMKDRMVASDGPFLPVYDLGFPSSPWLLSTVDFASLTLGQYLGVITECGSISQSVSDPNGEIQALTTTITFNDYGRDFARLLAGPTGYLVKGSSIVARLAHPRVHPSAWRTLFTGIIDDWGFEGMQVTLQLRTDDAALDRTLPKPGLALNRADRPLADPSAIGGYSPIVLGMQDSSSYQATGMIPCKYVDTVAFKYEPAIGRVGVGAVYVGGVSSSSATILYEKAGGKQRTVVDFSGVQTATITADVSGYESVGDGSGVLVDDPTDGIALLFSNFAFKEWLAGTWYPTSDRIDAARLAKLRVFCQDHLLKCARAILDATTGYDEGTAWLGTFEFKAWWTPEGKLAFAVEDPTDDAYPVVPVSFHDEGFQYVFDSQELTTAITVSYIKNAADGSWLQTLEVNNPRKYADRPTTLAAEWGQVA